MGANLETWMHHALYMLHRASRTGHDKVMCHISGDKIGGHALLAFQIESKYDRVVFDVICSRPGELKMIG